MDQPIYSELKERWYQVRVPVPFSLRYVNSYLLGDTNERYTIIDPGLKTEESIEVWETTLRQLQIKWQQIDQVIVTHQHPDHYGLAGYVQKLSDAVVYITEESHAYTQKLWGTGTKQFEADMRELLHKHETPAEIIERIIDNLHQFIPRVEPQPEVRYIQPAGQCSIAELDWHFVQTVGHAYGGIMLYQPEIRWMICADQVLPRITPHVGVVAGEERMPLYDFLQNLAEIRKYDVELALPGHREPFSNYDERIEQIMSHHERRLQKMYEYMKDQQTHISAFVMCEHLFGSSLATQPHNMRFALTETIAHLDELVRRRLLHTIIHSDVQYYKLNK